MKSAKRGKSTSAAEIRLVSARGFWLFVTPEKKEYFVSFESFPEFQDATIRELTDVEVQRGHLFRWPRLDIDLDAERILHSDRFPLVAKVSNSRKGTRGSRRNAA